jgi:hypothetical protein
LSDATYLGHFCLSVSNAVRTSSGAALPTLARRTHPGAVRHANGQAIAFVYRRDNDAEARQGLMNEALAHRGAPGQAGAVAQLLSRLPACVQHHITFRKETAAYSGKIQCRAAGFGVEHARIVDTSGRCPGFVTTPAFRGGNAQRSHAVRVHLQALDNGA